jgi:hypothetical protein
MKAKDLSRRKLRSKQIITLKYENFINIPKLNLKITHYMHLYWLSFACFARKYLERKENTKIFLNLKQSKILVNNNNNKIRHHSKNNLQILCLLVSILVYIEFLCQYIRT